MAVTVSPGGQQGQGKQGEQGGAATFERSHFFVRTHGYNCKDTVNCFFNESTLDSKASKETSAFHSSDTPKGEVFFSYFL